MKRRVILLLAVLTLLTAISPEKAQAFALSAEPSARLAGPQATSSLQMEQDHRAQILRSYLQQFDSPLADHADTIIKEADANQLDWKLVAAISGVESGFGKAIPPDSYNAWGFGVYGNNVRRFTSWDDGISVVSVSLRKDYMDSRGETTVYQIGSSYAASPTWAARVQGFMNDIDRYSHRINKPTLSISL